MFLVFYLPVGRPNCLLIALELTFPARRLDFTINTIVAHLKPAWLLAFGLLLGVEESCTVAVHVPHANPTQISLLRIGFDCVVVMLEVFDVIKEPIIAWMLPCPTSAAQQYIPVRRLDRAGGSFIVLKCGNVLPILLDEDR